jgi:hypothetical protein
MIAPPPVSIGFQERPHRPGRNGVSNCNIDTPPETTTAQAVHADALKRAMSREVDDAIGLARSAPFLADQEGRA